MEDGWGTNPIINNDNKLEKVVRYLETKMRQKGIKAALDSGLAGYIG